ncbi:MAG: OmpA family protein [Burkholderiaceae bacterium]
MSTAGSGAGDAASAGTVSQRAPSTAATASVGTDTRTGMTDSADTGTGSTQDNARGDEPERRPPTVLAQADNNLIDRAKEALTSGKSAATGAARSATESAQKAGEAIVDGAGRALDSAGSAASRGLEAAKSGAESLAGKAREAGGRAIDKTIEAGGAAAQAVAEGAGKAASSAKSAAGEAAASASRAVDRLREEAAPDRRAAPIEAAKPDSAKKPGAAESPGTGATPASGSRSAVDTPPPTEQASGGGTIGPLATLGPNLRSGGSGPAASSKSAAPESARPADGGKEAAKSAVTSANDRQIREPVVRLRCAELDVGVELTFGTGAQALGEREQAQLRAIAGCAKRSGSRLEIGGHTDSQGDSLENLLLSVKRAETVAESLSALGVTADKLSPRGYGESQPRADNFTAQGRALNRRVTIRRLQG